MEIIIDGVHDQQIQGDPEDLLAAFRIITDNLHAKRRAIVALRLNGDTISPEDVPQCMENVPINTPVRIEITTHDIDEMSMNCLNQLMENLPELPVACQELARIFQSGSPQDALNSFVELVELWRIVKERQLLVAKTQNIDMAAFQISGKSIQQQHTELNAFLNDALETMQSEDWIALGDLLEYELAPRADEEQQVVALLREQVAANIRST